MSGEEMLTARPGLVVVQRSPILCFWFPEVWRRVRRDFSGARKDGRMSQAVGFIGLGNLGAPMARNLLAAGFPVRVFNRTAEKARPLAELGATVARSTAGVA